MKLTKTYVSSASNIEPESPMGIVAKFIGEYHGGTAYSGGELNDGRTFQKLEYMNPVALDKKTVADMMTALRDAGYEVMNVMMKAGKFAGVMVAHHLDSERADEQEFDADDEQEFDADDGQWILEQLFDNGAIDEIKPLVDMAHVDSDEIDFELENIRDMGNGWVQFTLSGYHGQDAFESQIQLNMDNPDTYVLL